MIFVLNLKFFPSLFFVNINLEKVITDVLDRYNSLPGYIHIDVFKVAIFGIVLKGVSVGYS